MIELQSYSLLRKTRDLQTNTCEYSDSLSTAYDQACMEEVPGAQSYGCTANDVRVASTFVKQIRKKDGTVIPPNDSGVYSCTEGELLYVDFAAEMLNGAKSSRYDIAVWWRRSGNTALTSPNEDCAVTRFTNTGLTDQEDAGDVLTQDECGDIWRARQLFLLMCVICLFFVTMPLELKQKLP